MKKFLLSFGVILTYISYVIYQNYAATNVRITAPNLNISSTQSSSTQPTIQPGYTNNSSSQQKSQYKDGTYSGDPADAFYGTIQVQALIQNGKIADIQFLQYPNDRNESIVINTQAIPYLKQEAIQAQSAQVDIVSGATDSSQAFVQSLQSALVKARNS